ncbi:uncharacterized protein PV09_04600 [Verruconis gallopava]|uniref:K Homology domain-containing protein n=1 Tax=Verruconis gallopava TaxID=253628 RepID=A0A0D1YUF3_9PEZI|nr:uncharacterized protein PV09_04600 [Verruconis gallopava]KIW04307.1 hypothetical protein PV09_04600 [Verruconis gallopava]
MAAESSLPGPTAAGTDSESAAQKLLAKHTADEAHRTTVEDVVDEEDLAHPAPSATSDVAKGKQKVDDASAGASAKPKAPAFDVNSEEAFPSLGGPKAATTTASAWGKKPAANGTNGTSNGTSRASTPASGLATPTLPGTRPGGAHGVNIPGRQVERVAVPPGFLLPRQSLKKPIPEVVRDVNRRSKAQVAMKAGNNGGLIFEVVGTEDARRQAMKEVLQQIGSKQTIKVPVPASVRSHIIGRQGATIQDISKRSGARVQMPKQDELPADDEDAVIDVSVEGDFIASGIAKAMIEKIVDERTSNVSLRLKDIPAEFYPFIAGPNNSRIEQLENNRDIKINIPHYHTWRDAAPPQAPRQGQPTPFTPQASLPISITGDRTHAQQARQEIDELVSVLRRQLTVDQTPIDKGRHQFIVGDRGTSAHDFLAETGCALVKPPPGVDDDTLYVVGPADKLQAGLDKVMELASQMQSMNVDVAKPHGNARGGGHQHARNMTRYLKQKRALEELERMHDASIVLPASDDGPTAWEIYAKDFKNATKARQDIMNLVSAHPPSRFRPMQVDPFFHQALQQRAAPRIRREHGVHIVFPDGHMESPDLLLVYEQPGSPSEYVIPRQQCSPADAKEHERAIQQAMNELQALIAAHQAIESRQLEAAPKFHEKIRRYVDREQESLPQDQFPVQLIFGPPGRPANQRAPNSFSIRGPASAVDDLNAKILAFLEQEIKDDAERGFKMQFDYPQKFANHLIGKRGENINRLREEFDVDIQVKDGKVELTGPEKKCAACKSHILNQLKKLEDETTHIIKVKPQYHRDLIGPKGSQVNRLQDRYNVRINFPRNASSDDNASELGSVRNFRNQAADEVIIKGPKRGADEAREELLNLLQYVMDNSHVETLSVQQAQIPSLIGAGGREMDQLRLQTGCQIDIPNARDAADAQGRVEIKIKGTKASVAEAKKLLTERVKQFDETVTRNVDVDRKHHKGLIGAGGANIRKIVLDAGGPDDARMIARIVRFPKPGDTDNSIRVEGNKAMVDKIVSTIESYAKQRDEQVSDHIDVPADKHRLLIGRGGETRRNLESKFNVSIDIPRQGSDETKIKLTGLPADVESAKVHIATLTKEQQGETVDVPRKFHHAITDNGRIFRRLRDDYGVTVDHAGQQPPPRPSNRSGARGRNVNGNMPLLTDESAAADTHSWELVDNTATYEGTDGDATIPWILRGSNPESLAKAKAQIEAAIAKAAQPSWTGYLILPDSRSYGRIIGPGGSQINSIKKKTGCDIQVPRARGANGGGEAVEITGGKAEVEEARDIILNIVREAGSPGMGSRGGSRRG